jgi:hypothetical protein
MQHGGRAIENTSPPRGQPTGADARQRSQCFGRPARLLHEQSVLAIVHSVCELIGVSHNRPDLGTSRQSPGRVPR